MAAKRMAGRRIAGRTPLLVKGVLALVLLSRAASGFHVSPDGDDAGPGTEAQPFATLGRARDAVRQLIARGLEADVRVVVRAGTYYLPDGLTFSPEDSGTREFSVTYAACPGEVPILIGGVRLTGWRRHKEHIFVADIPEGATPGQLFEDGRRMPLARAPDEGYFGIERPVKGKERTAFVYRAGDLDPGGWDTSGARVFIWPGHDWFSQDKPVARIDPAARVVTMTSDRGYPMRPGNRYFVKNVLALLDAPGECMIDLDGRKIYAWPRAEPIEARTMVVSTARSIIAVHGKEARPVRNLHFEGFDLGIADGDAVSITGAEDCSVRNCMIENARECGVVIRGHARRVSVYGNLIRRHGLHGVHLQGLAPGKPDVNRDHVVENNHIHHCGRLVGHGYGVRVSQSGRNRIVHNHIHHMPRYATTIKGLRYQSLRKSVPGVTFENRHDFLHSRGNLFAYNHIHHVNLDSQDTGAMESWGPGRDNVYDHNLIHDVGNTRFTIQSGMYLDDATDHFTVTNNIIYGVVGSGGNQCIYAKGIGNRIANNILIVGPKCGSAIRSFFMAGERCDHHEYVRNIISFEGAPAPAEGEFDRGIGNLHDPGTTLTWKARVPADGAYSLWMRYAAKNAPYGRTDMGGRTTISVDGAKPVPLLNIPDTGGWGDYRWSRVAALEIARGEREFRWTNVKGGGMNLDALALSDDPDWEPRGADLPRPAPGRHVVTIQAETAVKGDRKGDRRAIYGFQNWTKDRVVACDHNVYHKPSGPLLMSGKSPGGKSYDDWRKAFGGRFDRESVAGDPMFIDAANRDYRLRPASPALGLGFKQIDTSRIGLKKDFPARFERE